MHLRGSEGETMKQKSFCFTRISYLKAKATYTDTALHDTTETKNTKGGYWGWLGKERPRWILS